MNAGRAKPVGAEPVPLWRRRSLQFVAVAVLALLAWAAYWLENVPVARRFGDDDAAKLRLAVDQPIALAGLAAGKAVGIRLVGAKRLDLTLPDGAEMRSPELAPFLAKAQRDAAILTGIECGANQTLLKALTEPRESVQAIVTLVDSPGGSGTSRTLNFQRTDPAQYDGGLRIWANGAKLRLSVDFNRSDQSSQAGRMVLCHNGHAVTLGHAEFDMPLGQALIAQFRDAAEGGESRPVAEFDFYSPQRTGLAAAAVATGSLGEGGAVAPARIACGAGGRTWLWRRIVPSVTLADCASDALTVTALDFASGQFTIAGGAVFFAGIKPDDTARLVSKGKDNLVVQGVLAALLGSLIIPWVLAQFKRRQLADRKPRTRRSRRPDT